MAVCNIFKPLSNNTGNFLMFSQYPEDLTKMVAQSSYRVSPSNFMALNIDYSKFDNTSFPTLLQNYFENGCAYKRNNGGLSYTQFKSMFWNCLYDKNLITITDNNLDQCVYVGDINLESYDTHGGMGYSEIYCYIPNDGKLITKNTEYGEIVSVFTTGNDYVEGYSENDYKEGVTLQLNGVGGIQYCDNQCLTFINNVEIDQPSFSFNTVIVFYDIYENDVKTQENIPLGIYLTGVINEDGTVNNSVTKYVSNDDIYGTGTSYGLRICSRFSAIPNSDNIKTVDVEIESTGYAELSYVLSEMSKTLTKMNDIVSNIHQNNQFLKNSLAIFKNSKVNVPYIKEVNGRYYWFVNGKNTYISPQAIPYTNNYIDKYIDDYDDILM